MKEIQEYFLISTDNPLEFDNSINKMINDGWQPYGNPFISSENKDTPDGGFYNHLKETYFHQAMVKYAK